MLVHFSRNNSNDSTKPGFIKLKLNGVFVKYYVPEL